MSQGVRVQILDMEGRAIARTELGTVRAANPPMAQPHLGKLGWMTEEPCPELGGRKNPRILLDDGAVLWGHECWWDYVKEDDDVAK